MKDLTGQRFGMLVAIRPTNQYKNNCIVWECKCDCGNTCYVSVVNLTHGYTKSCGCLKKRRGYYIEKQDVTGKKFGKLTAIRPTSSKSETGYTIWECRCDCGNICYVPVSCLIVGSTKSCGCEHKLSPQGVPLQLEGRKFDRLTVIKQTPRRKRSQIVWECRCDCGKTVYVPTGLLTSGMTRSCGCLQRELSSKMFRQDITGKRFGRLVAIKPTGDTYHGQFIWECRCDCGNICSVPIGRLNSGNIRSCGCFEGIKDLTGKRFGKLIAVRPTEKRLRGHVVWECKCDCGNICYVSSESLSSGNKKSCGCLRRRKAQNND